MLNLLTDKLRRALSKMVGGGRLTESNISEAVEEVRVALLEADVNYTVVKELIKEIKTRAIGKEFLKSVSPGQQFIQVVHETLIDLMGKEPAPLQLKGHPSVILLCGLQGAGKTTQCVKLARYLKKQGMARSPLVVPCDLQRPAAVQQLKILAAQAEIAAFESKESDPEKVAKDSLVYAKAHNHDVMIVDTAGRLHIDDALMTQLAALKEILKPQEVLFVANATTGQDAVQVALEFHQRVGVTGSILTMLDGNARGGAAISIGKMTGQPLKFEGIGEHINDFRPFQPRSMADRILGMGDVIQLVEKAKEHFDAEEGKKLEHKLKTATFTYGDFLQQIQAIKKMGPLKNLLAMLPGAGQLPIGNINEKDFYKIEVMIFSMTPAEREGKCELSRPRRKRIADGSGTTPHDVDRLVSMFKQAKELCKNMPSMKQLGKMMGGFPWR